MNKDSVEAYEKHAQSFLKAREASPTGIQVVDRWARSLRPDATIIEIACGAGIPVTRTLVDAGLQLWAIDASPTLLAEFKERFPGVPVECATVLESDYFQRTYDAAISIGLVFLLREADQIKMLRRVSEILRPGASFLFTAPVEVGTWTDVATGHTCVSLGQEAYERVLERSGFRLVGRHEDSGKSNYYEAQKVAGSTT